MPADHPDFPDAIERARVNAPFLAQALERLPDLAETLSGGKIHEALEQARGAGDGVAEREKPAPSGSARHRLGVPAQPRC